MGDHTSELLPVTTCPTPDMMAPSPDAAVSFTGAQSCFVSVALQSFVPVELYSSSGAQQLQSVEVNQPTLDALCCAQQPGAEASSCTSACHALQLWSSNKQAWLLQINVLRRALELRASQLSLGTGADVPARLLQAVAQVGLCAKGAAGGCIVASPAVVAAAASEWVACVEQAQLAQSSAVQSGAALPTTVSAAAVHMSSNKTLR